MANTVSPNPAARAKQAPRNASGTTSTGASLLERTLATTAKVDPQGVFRHWISLIRDKSRKHGKSRAIPRTVGMDANPTELASLVSTRMALPEWWPELTTIVAWESGSVRCVPRFARVWNMVRSRVPRTARTVRHPRTTHVSFLRRARRISAERIRQNDEAQNHQAGRSVCLRVISMIWCFIILPFRFWLRWVAGVPR